LVDEEKILKNLKKNPQFRVSFLMVIWSEFIAIFKAKRLLPFIVKLN